MQGAWIVYSKMPPTGPGGEGVSGGRNSFHFCQGPHCPVEQMQLSASGSEDGKTEQSRAEPIFGQGRSSLLSTPSDSPSQPARLELSSQPSDSGSVGYPL